MTAPVRTRVLIIGTGFAGLGMAIRLKQAGIHDFTVLERAGEVGGTWRDNTYPGAACDVPSHLYSFSFAPNPDWSRSFSPQTEIQAYLERTATDFGGRVRGAGLAYPSLYFLGILLFAVTLILNLIGDRFVRRVRQAY